MDELGGCLFELVMKTVTTKVGCVILIILAVIGGYLVYREMRADDANGPKPYQESRGGPTGGWRVMINL